MLFRTQSSVIMWFWTAGSMHKNFLSYLFHTSSPHVLGLTLFNPAEVRKYLNKCGNNEINFKRFRTKLWSSVSSVPSISPVFCVGLFSLFLTSNICFHTFPSILILHIQVHLPIIHFNWKPFWHSCLPLCDSLNWVTLTNAQQHVGQFLYLYFIKPVTLSYPSPALSNKNNFIGRIDLEMPVIWKKIYWKDKNWCRNVTEN